MGVLVDLKLIFLAIELCCLLGFEVNDQTTISFHQKFKVKTLESSKLAHCTKCVEIKLPLLPSNFPSLIQCLTANIDIVIGCGNIR